MLYIISLGCVCSIRTERVKYYIETKVDNSTIVV